ncbi:MAG TPA: hypothetical protein VL329_08900 [Nitrospiraceae bacterium]|nr:hypothetical protein [Nitrospiraceae bacterium]
MASTLMGCIIMESRPQSMGDITVVRGNVFLARTELTHPEAVMQSHPLYAYDVLESQAQSGADISLPHARLILGPNSRLTFHEPTGDRRTIIALERGTLRLQAWADSEEIWTVEILAFGSSTVTYHGEITVWVQEDLDGQETAQPVVATIRSIGVINHGTQGEATFEAMGRRVVVRPGYLSVTAPDHPPIPAVAMELAKTFVTDIVQTTKLNQNQNQNNITAMNPLSPPPVKRMTETVAQRACKKQKEQALRVKPSVDQSKTRLTHCL